MQSREYETVSGETITIQNIKDGPCRHDSIEKLPATERLVKITYQCRECFSRFSEEEYQLIVNQ
ncbi:MULTISPECIES: hypothetical protein [Acinetobacter calcoaceticus/baumannii complex]|uniref:hypothetical protein n=1 Tax=Acinetobacter calcoaceticus/baumannii complex TaxID=909768 RepID=UPI0009C164A6|nr:hypothetical protein [Acinetobacter pittii]